jgi:hypothetical protein
MKIKARVTCMLDEREEHTHMVLRLLWSDVDWHDLLG